MNSQSLEPIPFDASARVRSALECVGRTEDVKLSPDGSRLALAAFADNRIYVFSIGISRNAGSPSTAIQDYVTIESNHFNQPHGLDFIGNEHVIVCNRGADVTIFQLPSLGGARKEYSLQPLASISGKDYLGAKVKTPGSVACYQTGDQQYRALVCSDQWHFVTAHGIRLGKSVHIANEGVLIEKSLKIPDGICISPDSRWIAISNHVYGQVVFYENTQELNRNTEPAAVLEGTICPHGLCFDPQGNLYVADATSPYVYVYELPEAGWRGTIDPTSLIRVLDNDTFYTGRYACREGGVKGIHIDHSTGVLITTHKLGVLEFWDLQQLRDSPSEVDRYQLAELRRERDLDFARNKSRVLRRSWNFSERLREELRPLRGALFAFRRFCFLKLITSRLLAINRCSRKSILDPAGPVVSLTSHSQRIQSVYLAIESMALGALKPGRLILWLSDRTAMDALPTTLKRLEGRGLEIKLTEDFGPHTKYYPFLETTETFSGPLVTADDDVLYPPYWLKRLVEAYDRNPEVIHCFRARRMRLNSYHFEPYPSWDFCSTSEPDHLNFVTGVSGAVYPPEFLKAIKTRGRGFQKTCPLADDIWLTALAFQAGFKIAQVTPDPRFFRAIPGTQDDCLADGNVERGENQVQLAQSFSAEDRAALLALSDDRKAPLKKEARTTARPKMRVGE